MLYLSLYLKQHRNEYYELLNNVRLTGNWEAWLTFFLEGVKRTADGAVGTVEQLNNTFRRDRNRIEGAAGRKVGSALRVHEALKETGLSFHATASAMSLLISLGIAREITGKQRNRRYVYDEYLSMLNEGTEV